MVCMSGQDQISMVVSMAVLMVVANMCGMHGGQHRWSRSISMVVSMVVLMVVANMWGMHGAQHRWARSILVVVSVSTFVE